MKPSIGSALKMVRSGLDACKDSFAPTLSARYSHLHSSFHRYTDYTVICDECGDWFYADVGENGRLVATPSRVGAASPRLNTPKNLHMHVEALDCEHELCPDNAGPSRAGNLLIEDGDEDIELRRQRRLRKLSSGGVLNNLVVLMRFSDHRGRDLPTQQELNILFNGSEEDCRNNAAICGDSGSVQSYYRTFSHGQLTINSHVTQWIDVPYTESQAADGSYG